MDARIRRRMRKPHFSANAFLAVANVVYMLLAMLVLTLAGCFPLLLAFVFVPDFGFYPLFLAAAALCAPGIAASFAIFRDHPVFQTSSRSDALSALADAASDVDSKAGGDANSDAGNNAVSAADSGLPDWIASAYVRSDVSVAVFRPYVRAYVRLFWRALIVGVTFGVIEFVALYDAQLLMQVGWGQLLVPMLLVVAVVSAEAELLALNLVVEFPKARWGALLRNGYLFSVRRVLMLVVNLACLGVYTWGLTRSPILVATLATGVLIFVVWAGVRWQSQPLALAMARESGDRRLVALYE